MDAGRLTSQLRRSRSHLAHERRGIDDRSANVEAFGFVRWVLFVSYESWKHKLVYRLVIIDRLPLCSRMPILRRISPAPAIPAPNRKSESDTATHLPHSLQSPLTSKPNPLDINRLSEVPDRFGGEKGVVIGGVHYAGVVELCGRSGRRGEGWGVMGEDGKRGGEGG